MLIQVVQHNLGDSVALEHNHQALAGAARSLIADIRNARELAFLDEVGNLDCKIVGVYLIRQLGDHKTGSSLDFFHRDNGPHRDGATTGAIRVMNSLGS